MVIFEIRDDSIKMNHLLGYLFYFERSKRFYAELMPDLTEWDAPFIFSAFVKKGLFSIDASWSERFVNQRIVPTDRQNLGTILRDNKLNEYNIYKLLLLSEGRCAQDEIYLNKIHEDDLRDEIKDRLKRKVRDLLPVSDFSIYISFQDGHQTYLNCDDFLSGNRTFTRVISDKEVFMKAKVSPGGNGIEWGDNLSIPAESLYKQKECQGIPFELIDSFIAKRLVDTTEAVELLNCSRQYINQLVKDGKLIPNRVLSNNNLFLRSDLERESF